MHFHMEPHEEDLSGEHASGEGWEGETQEPVAKGEPLPEADTCLDNRERGEAKGPWPEHKVAFQGEEAGRMERVVGQLSQGQWGVEAGIPCRAIDWGNS